MYPVARSTLFFSFLALLCILAGALLSCAAAILFGWVASTPSDLCHWLYTAATIALGLYSIFAVAAFLWAIRRTDSRPND